MTTPLKRLAITGGAGFIGSHLVDACVGRDYEVTVIDNLSVGKKKYIQDHLHSGRVRLVEGNILEPESLLDGLRGADLVFHLAANPDSRRGLENPRIDLELELLTTFQVLEGMRALDIPRIIFASSGTVYGDVGTLEVTEDYGPCQPVSMYGAGKAAAEAFLSAYTASFDIRGIVCRLGNVIGERATHGVLFDFVEKLRRDRSVLEVLGDGHQAKPYIYVRELVEALLFLTVHATEQFGVYNIAPRGATTVGFLARTLLDELGLHDTRLEFGETKAGWRGDIAQSRMSPSKLGRLGWSPRYSSDEAARVGIREFVKSLRWDDVHA